MFFVLLLSLLYDACDGIINQGVCCVCSFCSLNMSHSTPTQHLRLDFHALTLALPLLYVSLSICCHTSIRVHHVGELGDRPDTLRNSVLQKFARKNLTNCNLDLP